jgi:GNAT superfamily N-acetyltransferase
MNRDNGSSRMSLQPVLVEDADTLREIIFGLRVESWKSVGVLIDGTYPPDVCRDEHDEHALHWVVRDGERLAGAARMCIHDDVASLPDDGFFLGMEAAAAPPIASLNRLVVHPAYQRRGLSRELDRIRIQKAREMSCRSVWCVAPPIRWEPLRQQGFEEVAPVDLSRPPRWIEVMRQAGVPEIPRRIMALTL